jgi:hypothetical protein
MQELEETLYWLELLEESGIVVADQVSPLQKEANEIMAIMVASVKTAKGVSSLQRVSASRATFPHSPFSTHRSALSV